MKTEVMFNYDYLFGDHMAKVSHQAKLYYIKLMFYANNGFVSNPLEVLDSLGYQRDVFYELIANGEILNLPDRSEIFITAYFIHNHFKPMSWMATPFSVYWKGKLFIKKNGVATFTPQAEEPEQPKAKPDDNPEPTKKQSELNQAMGELLNVVSQPTETKSKWDELLDDIETPK